MTIKSIKQYAKDLESIIEKLCHACELTKKEEKMVDRILDWEKTI